MKQTTKENVVALAGKIMEFATLKKWGATRLRREFPDIGSERTFRDMCAGKTDGYDLETQELNLRVVVAQIEELNKGEVATPIYDSLRSVLEVRRAVAFAMRSTGNNRVVLVQGAPGSGKTTAANVVAKLFGERILMMEAADAWNDSPMAFLGALLGTLGAGKPPASAAARLEACKALLAQPRRCIIIDEAHHLGPRCLNTIKNLVNLTPGEFVLMTIPTLWARLESEAYQEARQVTTNRLSERVKLAVTENEATEYFALAVPTLTTELARIAAKAALPDAFSNGNFAFLRDVARFITAENPEAADITAAIAAAKKRR